MSYHTFVAKTIAGYGAQIANHDGPICAYGIYYPTPDLAEKDAIEWAAYERNCEYSQFNWNRYFDELDKSREYL